MPTEQFLQMIGVSTTELLTQDVVVHGDCIIKLKAVASLLARYKAVICPSNSVRDTYRE